MTDTADDVTSTSVDDYQPGGSPPEWSATTAADFESHLPALGLRNALVVALFVVLAAFSTYIVAYGQFTPYSRTELTVLVIGFAIGIQFLSEIESILRRESKSPVDVLAVAGLATLLVVSVVGSVYIFVTFDSLLDRTLNYYWYEYVFAGAITISLLEGARRAFGWLIPGVAILTGLYAYFGHHIPGVWGHPGYDLERMLEVLVLNFAGVYGSLGAIAATWIAIFLIYAGIIESLGGMEFIKDVAVYVGGKFQSGIAQCAVATSLFMGSITGSAVANTAATGSFTIPLMKRYNVSDRTSAAIESISSSGGQVMPPVMGAAAFLMADFLGINYSDLLIHAFIPAVLFYVAVIIIVAMVTTKENIVSPDFETDRSDLLAILANGSHIVLSVLALVYVLVVLQYDPLTSGVVGIFVLVAASFGLATVDELRSSDQGVVIRWVGVAKQVVHGLVVGARNVIPIIIVVGPIIMVVRIATLTGVNQTLSRLMLLYGSTLLVLLIIGALMAIVFGLGMPTVAAYMLVSIFVVPGLAEFGVQDLHSHLFVFYFAVLSGLTPPVAVVVAVAAGISGANFLQACLKSLKLSIPIFLIPFVFVYNGELVVWTTYTPITTLCVVVGIYMLSSAIVGTVFDVEYSTIERGGFLLASLAILFVPSIYAKIAIAVVSVLYVGYRQRTGRAVGLPI